VDKAESDLLESLDAELNTWRKTSFDRLIERRDKLPALKEAVRRDRPDEQEAVRLEDIRSLLIRVVAAVEGAQSAGIPADSKGRISNPAVLREIFGLTAQSKNARVEMRQRLAGDAEGLGNSQHTIRQNTQGYVEQLTAWLRDYLQPAASVPRLTPLDYSIPRPDDLLWLHITYRRLAITHGGLFLLWGLAGMGKTTLARQFAYEIGPEKLTGFIRIGRRGLYEEDIRRILRTEGHDTSSWSDEHCQALFRTVARKFRTIRLLILDDPHSESDISALIPESSNVPVLVTSRGYLRFTRSSSSAQPPSRQLLPFTAKPSETFLQSQIPKLDANTISELSKMLGGHAETMHHVVRYLITDNALSPEALLEELGRSAHRTLTDLTEVLAIPSGLPFILRQLHCQLADAPFANAILTSIIWTNSSGEQPRDLIIEIVSKLLSRS